MQNLHVLILWALAAFVCICKGEVFSTLTDFSACGDWKPYRNEKCLKIASKSGPQSKKDGEDICRTYADGRIREYVPKLLTIRSEEELEFVIKFLFSENEIVDHVWLGLKRNANSGVFEWNDGKELIFNNWSNQTLQDEDRDCVEMESGEGPLETGIWYKVSCRRKNAVVCEKMPTWSIETVQNMLLEFKVSQETMQKEWKKKEQELEQEIEELKMNPVPVGFIYVQIPGQDPPTTLWPAIKWTDVSSAYAGLFFRVVGGNAAPFGQVQEGNSSYLGVKHSGGGYDTTEITVAPDGNWSKKLATSTYVQPAVYESVQFRLITSEVRPRNYAVKIWKRTE